MDFGSPVYRVGTKLAIDPNNIDDDDVAECVKVLKEIPNKLLVLRAGWIRMCKEQ